MLHLNIDRQRVSLSNYKSIYYGANLASIDLTFMTLMITY